MSGIYDADLAAIHSEGYSATYGTGFDWLCDRILAGPSPAVLYDVGCGDGTWLAHAAKRGIKGAGCDLSPPFVAMAQARRLDVTLARAGVVTIPEGTTAVTALGEVLSYIDVETGEDSLEPLARRAFDALPSGGLLIADMPGPDVPTVRGHSNAGEGWEIRTEVRAEEGRVRRRIETVRAGVTRVSEHVNSARAPEAAAQVSRDMGWDCALLESYGPAPLLPGRYVLSAVKP